MRPLFTGFHLWRSDRALNALRRGRVSSAAIALGGLIFAAIEGYGVLAMVRDVGDRGLIGLFRWSWVWWAGLASCWCIDRGSGFGTYLRRLVTLYPAVVVRALALFVSAIAIFQVGVIAGLSAPFEASGLKVLGGLFVVVVAALILAGLLLPLLWFRRAFHDLATSEPGPRSRVRTLWYGAGRVAVVGLMGACATVAITAAWSRVGWQRVEAEFESRVGPLEASAYGLPPRTEPEPAGEARAPGDPEFEGVPALDLSEEESAFVRQAVRDDEWQASALHRERLRELVVRNEAIFRALAEASEETIDRWVVDANEGRWFASDRYRDFHRLLAVKLHLTTLEADDAPWRNTAALQHRLGEALVERGRFGLTWALIHEIETLDSVRAHHEARRAPPRSIDSMLGSTDLIDALQFAMGGDTVGTLQEVDDEMSGVFARFDGPVYRFSASILRSTVYPHWRQRILLDPLAWHAQIGSPYSEVVASPPQPQKGLFSFLTLGWSEDLCRVQLTLALRELARQALELQADGAGGTELAKLRSAIDSGAGPQFLPFSTTPILLEESSTGVFLTATPEPEAIEACDFHDRPPLALRWRIGD